MIEIYRWEINHTEKNNTEDEFKNIVNSEFEIMINEMIEKFKTTHNNVDNVQCLHKVGTVISTHVVCHLRATLSEIKQHRIITILNRLNNIRLI